MNKTKITTLLVAFMAISSVIMATPPGNGNGGGGGAAPIDGGILTLVAGVIAYGYNSFKARKG